jgi:hypothetical protein
VFDNEEDSDIAVPLSGLANENIETHHGLYWQRDGVLEEPKHKMPFSRRRLKPECVKKLCDASRFHYVYFPLDILENHCA